MDEEVSVGECLPRPPHTHAQSCHLEAFRQPPPLWKLKMRPVQRNGLRRRPLWTLSSTTQAVSRDPLFALQKLSTIENQVGFPLQAASIKTFLSCSALNQYERMEAQAHLGLSAEKGYDLNWQKVKFLNTFNNCYWSQMKIWIILNLTGGWISHIVSHQSLTES